MNKMLTVAMGLGLVAMMAGCAPKPVPTPIYAEPVFDKYGNPSCRPPNMPVGGVYTADLPVCALIAGRMVMPDGTIVDENGVPIDTTGGGSTPTDPTDPGNGTQNQNQNQNQNNNQNQEGTNNQNRNQNG